MKPSDRKSSAFWMAFSVVVILLSLNLPIGKLAAPGAGFLPLLAGGLMFLLSLGLFVQTFFGKEERPRAFWAKEGAGKVFWILLSLLLYGGLLERLGFILSTFLLMAFLLAMIGKQRKTLVLFVSLLSSLGCFAVFQLWLNVQLPKGVLGF